MGLFLTLFVGSSCTKEEVKLTSCDSLNKSLISNLNRADSLRLVSCLKLTGCDSVSLGILKPTNEIALRLNCIVGIGENYGGGIVFKVDSSLLPEAYCSISLSIISFMVDSDKPII